MAHKDTGARPVTLPWNWWPFFIGFSLVLVFLGLAVGIWVTIIGVSLALITIVGWTYEYYRGNFGHEYRVAFAPRRVSTRGATMYFTDPSVAFTGGAEE